MIELKHVSKAYGTKAVLSDVSLRIQPNEFVCLTGTSGSGKSTLLSLLIAAEHPTKGKVEVDGVELRRLPPDVLQLYRRRVGVVFQDRKLIPDRTVAENIALPLEMSDASASVIRDCTASALLQMHLAEKAGHYPAALSAGESTRTAIGRAIVHQPLILLADEPTAGLDRKQAEEVLAAIRRIHAEGATVILATSDTALAASLNARIISLDQGTVEPPAPQKIERAKAAALKRIERNPKVAQAPRRRVRITSIRGRE